MNYKKNTLSLLILFIIAKLLPILIRSVGNTYSIIHLMPILRILDKILLLLLIGNIIIWIFSKKDSRKSNTINEYNSDAKLSNNQQTKKISRSNLLRGVTLKGRLVRIGMSKDNGKGWTKYSSLQTDGFFVENIYVDDYVDSFIELDINNEFVFKKFFFWQSINFLVAIKSDGIWHKMKFYKLLIILGEINIITDLLFLPLLVFTTIYLMGLSGDIWIALIFVLLVKWLIVSLKPIIFYFKY